MTEVLAPAGSPEGLRAAVMAGADAVYFGAPDFNARKNAANFTEEDMRQAAEYARVRGVKTYLTLNTLVSDGEMKDALRTAHTAAAFGIDALIVQDLGLAAALKKHLPNMPLHASTQMSVHGAAALKPLCDMGFKRVVAAREMDRKALGLLCEEAARLGMEVEVFVHGALCMCLSGQCYLSAMLGGRSGNRGLCAQPCRLEFHAPDGKDRALSLKDMSLAKYIGELTLMGVVSFKIEGRMKRPEYAAAATAVFRAAADGKEIPKEAEKLLSGIFSRGGHTDGYFTGNRDDMFGSRSEDDKKLSGELLNTAHALYRRERQSVALTGRAVVAAKTPMRFTVSDGAHTVTVAGDVPESAMNREITADRVSERLGKCGGTCYDFQSLTVDTEAGLAVSAASLGALRKKALEEMDRQRAAYDGARAENSTVDEFVPWRHSAKDRRAEKNPASLAQSPGGRPAVVARFRSPETIPDRLSGVAAAALPCECDFERLFLPDHIPIIADIPRGVLHDEEKIIKNLESAAKHGAKAALCGNLASFHYAKAAGLVPIADFGMNLYNSHSVKAAGEFGAVAAVASFELSAAGAAALEPSLPLGIISYGRLPLMTFRCCPGSCNGCGGRFRLRDRKGIEFPVMCRGEFSELYNSRPVWMLDRQEDLRGFAFQVLYFTDETKEQCERVLESIGKPCAGEYTRGLYYRGVL